MNKLIRKNFPTLYRAHRNQSGIVFITVLLVGLLLTFVGLSMANVAILQLRRTNDNVFLSNAFLSAEAGIEQTLYQLNSDNSFQGYSSEVTFFDGQNQGRGTYQTTISSGSGNERIITSVGKMYKSNGQFAGERKVKVSLVGTASNTPSVYAGAGGLTLGGSARINNSDVHVNGTITLAGAAAIGSDTKPANVSVANYNCPSGTNPGPTFPALCTSGQPIHIGDWQNTPIIGTVCATGQTQVKFPESQWNNNAPQIRAGTGGGQGLIPGCVAPLAPMPTYDRAGHISRVTTTGVGSNINYNCSSWRAGDEFRRTWPGDLRLTGDVKAESSCDLTITGDVYITGNLAIGGGATIRVADSLGGRVPVIITDGTITAGAGGKILANSSGTAPKFISYEDYSNCDPNCTGTNLKRSQDLIGITVNGGGQYPGTAFQAYWSTVKISEAGLVGSAVGQKVDMSGAGSVTFGTSLSSGTTTWTIRSYQYDY